ncbi:dienelactone hydrolase family protein [candidate division KSB3 bacterium]|uniref:Dienelactone hydrolase family protein n=1 Tax=candidate division KSB3 bacterium TaxID=2044937 RepID=A0A9D5JXC2_9BACT|nr:dienelactone hydrolase family protein [candidate division KSB3 bacterium]MBD3325835.1 dienelactone hydrolase family protein [candidate division KSB3 bacterium]
MKKYILTILLVGTFAVTAQAAVVMQPVEYTHGDTVLEGYLAYDDAIEGPRPGVLVVHEWWGLNDYTKMRTEMLADMGYVAFAVDMYGKGQATKDPQMAAKWAGHVRTNQLMRDRAKVGLDVLLQHDQVDPERVAAIGFCFGGTTVLELAYSGLDVEGVVSFHGGLTSPKPEDMDSIKAKFLVLHGANDPHVKPEAIDAFQAAMKEVEADWQMIFYGGAVHSFSNPEAGDDPSTGAAYNEKAAKRSWKHMQVFFEEIFQE